MSIWDLRYIAVDAGSSLTGTFAVDSSGSVGFQGAANLAVNLQTDLGNAKFPSISAELAGTWDFGNSATGKFAPVDPADPYGFGNQPAIKLNNVTLDIGSFLKQFLLPIYNDIMAVIAPFQPVIDLFNSDSIVPLLSQFLNSNDLTEQNFDIAGLLSLNNPNGYGKDDKVTLLDLMALDKGNATYQTFVKAISAINSFEQLESSSAPPATESSIWVISISRTISGPRVSTSPPRLQHTSQARRPWTAR